MVISSIFNEKTIYLHTAWAHDESGSGFSLEEFDGAVFIGNYTSSSATESGNFASYSWKRIDNIEDPDETIEDEDLEDDTEDDEEFIEDEEDDDDDDGTYLDEDLEEDLIEIEAAAVRSGDNIASNQQANDSGIGNVNLLYGTNSGKSGYSVSGGFVLSDLDTTIYDDAEEVKAVRITCDTASDTAYLSFGSDYLLDNLSEMSAGDVFTLSFDSRMSVLFVSETLAVQGIDGAKRMLLFDQSLDNTPDNEEIDNTGEWVHYSAQAVYEEQETAAQVFCISLKNMPAGSTLDIANLKIEEGSLETPWRQSEDEIAGIARRAQDTANAAVSNVDVEYYLSTSSTSLSGGSWSTIAPAWVDGKYMWSRTVKTDGAGNKTYSPSQNGVCIAGAKGATGAKGDKGEPGTDGTNGTNGTDGRGVSSIVEQYYKSTSATSLSDGSWTDTYPGWENGKYIWTRSVITYTEGSPTTTAAVCVTGEKGSTGNKGDKGDTGPRGIDVKSVTRYYYLSATAPTTPSTSWTTTEPTYDATTDANKSLYYADYTTYSSGSPSWSAISKSSSYEAAKQAYKEAEAAAKKLASWCAKNNQVLIDGSKIYAGSIAAEQIATGAVTADKISVQDLKALQAKIGGFTIGDTNLRNGTTTLAGADNSVYLGLDGISCGKTFKVDEKGNMNATSGFIGGFTIRNSFLNAISNGFTQSFLSGLSAPGRPDPEYEAGITISSVPHTGKYVYTSAQNGYTPISTSAPRRMLEFISLSLTQTTEAVVNDVASIGVTYDHEKDESKLVLKNNEGSAHVLLGSDIDLWAGENSDLNIIANTVSFTGGDLLFNNGQHVGTTEHPSGLHTLQNNVSVGFLTTTGERVRGIALSSSNHWLFGRGDTGKTDGMFFYVGAKETFGIYGGTTKDVRFRSFEANDGSMYIQAPDVWNRTTSSGANVRVTKAGTLYHYSSSSMRYKTDITTKLSNELDPERLYDLKVWQYKYREGYLNKNDQRYGQDIIGFIAEDVKQKYPIAANYDEDGQIENWNVEMIVPAMLKLIQDQKKEIDELKERLN